MWLLQVVHTLQLLHPLIALRKSMVQGRWSALHEDPYRLPEQRNDTDSNEKSNEHGADRISNHQVISLHQES